jgi:HPt (histidine-containing phosphotransfer) domain-containing protein
MDRNPDPDTPLNDTSATPHSERTTVRDFIRNARDPVNAIIGVGEILGQSDLTPDQQECLALINASAQTLKRLRQAAHTIKGSAGTAGAEIVADRASQINRTIRKGVSDREVLVGFVDELEKEAVVFLNLLMHTHRQDNT